IVQMASTLPAGLSFSPDGHGYGTIQGAPSAGTGGEYPIWFDVIDPSSGSVILNSLRLRIGEAPSLTLPPIVYLMAGVPGSVTFDPAGYPKAGGMTVRLQPGYTLPPGMTSSDVATFLSATGNNYTGGPPSASGAGRNYPLSSLIQNTYGQIQVGTILHIVPAGDVPHDDRVDCSDVTAVKSRLNAKAGDASYLVAADVNGDGV